MWKLKWLLSIVISTTKGHSNEKFQNWEQNRTYFLCTFLDPRFKFYFEGQNIAEEVKKMLSIWLVLVSEKRNVHQYHLQLVNPKQRVEALWRNNADGIIRGYSTFSRQSLGVKILYSAKHHQNIYSNLSRVTMKKLNVLARGFS